MHLLNKWLTLNQLIQKLNDFATAHQQIHSFGFGDLWEIEASGAKNGAVMWANVVNGSVDISGKQATIDFRICFMDLVKKDESNENEVLSDMYLVALDMIAYLNNNPNWDNFTIANNSTMTPFTERFDSEWSGWIVDITLQNRFVSDYCQIPLQ